MKATEHIEYSKKPEVKAAPKIGAKEEEPRPPENVSAIQKQVEILEEQSLTSRQQEAVTEIRKILGIAPDSPEVDNTLPAPEPPPEPLKREEDHAKRSNR